MSISDATRYWLIEWTGGSNRFSLRDSAFSAVKNLTAMGHSVTISWHTESPVSQEAHNEPDTTEGIA